MKIKTFSPTTDWHFVFADIHGKKVNYQLAGFAVIEGVDGKSDEVVGMVPVTGGGENKIMSGLCRLTTVPPVEGTYMHTSEL
jgi:hypothetical protein